MDLNQAASQLVQALISSNEFENVKQTKVVLDKNPAHKEKFDSFQKRQLSLYSNNLSKEKIDRLMNEIDDDYKQLIEIPQINDYFNAGDKFNKLLNNLMNFINDSLKKQLTNQSNK